MFKNLMYRFEYAVVLFFDRLFLWCPRSVALWFGERVGLLLSVLLPQRRRLVLSNLAQAFPQKNSLQRSSLAQTMWKNVGRVAIEFVRLSDVTTANVGTFFSIEGQEHLDAVKKAGTGLIAIGFHYGNWEYCGAGLQWAHGHVTAIARPMKNPYVEKWVQSKRQKGHLDIILHRQAVKASLKAIKAKRVVGILVDQNLYHGGVFIRFFGRWASSTTLPALLHSRTEAPVCLVYTVREPSGKFKLIIEPPIQFETATEGEDSILKNTQLISDHIERVIAHQPEQWFWLHNRWKRQPESAEVR